MQSTFVFETWNCESKFNWTEWTNGRPQCSFERTSGKAGQRNESTLETLHQIRKNNRGLKYKTNIFSLEGEELNTL